MKSIFFGKKRETPAVPPTRREQHAPPPPRSAFDIDFKDTVAPIHQLTDAKEIDGEYVTFDSFSPVLGEEYREDFALMRHSDTAITLVMAGGAANSIVSRRSLELRRRVRERGFSSIEQVHATPEVIKVLHETHTDQPSLLQDTQTEVEEFAWKFIQQAVEAGTSDIHIETRGPQADVFFRIHGERVQQQAMSSKTAKALVSTLYNVHADASNTGTSWKEDAVNDTAVERMLDNKARVQLRMNTTPIYPKPNIQCTMRVLRMDEGSSSKKLNEVGYSDEQVNEIEQMLVGSNGLVLLVGPTNSGKSTTMQAFIRRIYEKRGKTIKVSTIEDPVEYLIRNACQHGVPRGQKKEGEVIEIYNKLLASLLRQDPDVAMVGEIRTREQAEPVKDMVLAGRKIFSTLHAYEAMTVYDRLGELGIPQSILCRQGFISGIIYQRLVPLLCQNCAIPLNEVMQDPSQQLIERDTFRRVRNVCLWDKHTVKLRGPGCEHCKGMGIVGRTPCAELLTPNEEFLVHLRKGDQSEARQWWFKNGMQVDKCGVTAVGHAISKIRKGLISPVDVEREIGKIEIAHPMGMGRDHQGDALEVLTSGRASSLGSED